MKILLLSICILTVLLSCKSIEKEENEILQITPVQETPEVGSFAEIITSDFLKPSIYYPSIESIELVYPQVDSELLIVKNNISDNPILRLLEFKKLYFKFNTIQESPFDENEVTSIYSYESQYYVGTLRGGVYQYDFSSLEYFEIKKPYDSMFNNSITGLTFIKNHLIISSYSGLFSYGIESKVLAHVSDDLDDQRIVSLYGFKNKIILGTVNGSLYEWDLIAFDQLLHLRNNSINDINYINGELLLGTSKSGIVSYLLDSTADSSSFESNNVNIIDKNIKLIAHFDDKYWISTQKGNLHSISNLENSDNHINYVQDVLCFTISKNYIYFGTRSDGLWFYDKINKTWG